jgi:hypothetical protein
MYVVKPVQFTPQGIITRLDDFGLSVACKSRHLLSNYAAASPVVHETKMKNNNRNDLTQTRNLNGMAYR